MNRGPECGFLFPTLKDRSSDIHRIDIYAADGRTNQAEDLRKILFYSMKHTDDLGNCVLAENSLI
jgi:hypothetical protein